MEGDKMTMKEKKEYLSGYIRAQNEITAAMCEIRHLEDIATKVNQVLEYRPFGGNTNDNKSKVEEAAVEIQSMIERIRPYVMSMERTKQEITNVINSKSKYKRQRLLLIWRYTRRMSDAEIAVAIGKDVRTVQRAMRKAIYDLNI
jgi:DNA-directed RNA polymerase specialized sigma24 family protein